MPGDASDRYDPDYGYKGPRKINKQDGSSSLPKAQPKKQRQQSAAPAVDPMAAFYAMLASMGDFGGGASHAPTGPSEEELAQQAQDKGLNDLDKAFGGYIQASENATEYVNTQIDTERSNAALMGIAYNITDEAKTQRISDYFSTIYSADDYKTLTDLNTDWGEFRDGDPLEFLVQRGVDVKEEDGAGTGADTKGFGATKVNSVFKKTFTNSPDAEPEAKLGAASLAAGG